MVPVLRVVRQKHVYMIPYEGNLLIPEVNTIFASVAVIANMPVLLYHIKQFLLMVMLFILAAEKPENVESEIKTPVEFPF